MWTDGNGFFYIGDCRQGDRAATDAEITAWRAAQVAAAAAATPTLAELAAQLATLTAQINALGA